MRRLPATTPRRLPIPFTAFVRPFRFEFRLPCDMVDAFHFTPALCAIIHQRRPHTPTTAATAALDLRRSGSPNVHFGSLADIAAQLRDVCFTPESGHRLSALECPLCARSGLRRVLINRPVRLSFQNVCSPLKSGHGRRDRNVS